MHRDHDGGVDLHEHRWRSGGGGGRESALKAAAVALSLLLVAEIAALCIALTDPQPDPEQELEPVVVSDAPAERAVPIYYQRDERWGGLPYATADSCVAESGCGLCCAAMAASYLTGEDITPPVLLNRVGNRCIDGGVNHMGRFCEELRDLYGIEYRGLWTLEDAEGCLRDGWMLFAGMEGAVYEGGKEYGGHVLLIWKCDEEGVYIRDPDDPTLQAPISWERFRSIEWGSYFYAIR